MSLTRRVVNRLRCLIEGPQLRERTVVKTVEAGQARMSPGFIIGVYRSGTTLLRYVLDSHSRIAVPPESNFLLSLAELHDDPWVRKGLRGVGVDDQALRERLRGFAHGIFDDYARAKDKQRWLDKTPGYAAILPFLNAVFGPRCRYIMLYRHGLDVANSMAARCENGVVFGPAKRYVEEAGVTPRVGFARYWAELCGRMLAFEAEHPSQCLRLRYEDYAGDPQRFLPPVFEFLGEPWQPQVLEYHRRTHDFGLQDHKVTENRGFAPVSGTYRDWSADDRRAAGEVAGPVLERLGYDL
jgi:protein-tyrosine sulfotransferase